MFDLYHAIPIGASLLLILVGILCLISGRVIGPYQVSPIRREEQPRRYWFVTLLYFIAGIVCLFLVLNVDMLI